MWSLQNQLFTLCIVLSHVTSAAGLIHVSGYEGREAKVSCRYGQGYESYEKYLCRNDCGDADVLIMTTKGTKSRYSISDDKSNKVFTTIISDLSSTDAGKYWCGVTRTGKDIYTEVKLDVKPDHCCEHFTEVQGYEDSSVSISCPYESEDRDNLKYICRGNKPSTCLQEAEVTSNLKQNGQFSLNEDKTSRNFTVTITSLTQKDSGIYLCGVHRNTGLDVFSGVNLEVKEWCCVKSYNRSGIVGLPVTMECSYPPQHRTNMKFLCKGDQRKNCRDMVTSQSSSYQTDHRFTLQDDTASSSFLVTIKELKASDAGTYWCGSDRQWSAGNYAKIQLSVEWFCVKSYNLSGIVRLPVTMECSYPPQHRTNMKFLCKGDHRNNCTDMVTSQSSSDQTDHRFTLQDDAASSLFLVTIKELNSSDAGTYWCGSDRQWSAGNYTKIQLSVDFQQQTSTVEPVRSQVTQISGGLIKDATPFHIVVFIVPAVLLILIFALVVLYKYRCSKVQGTNMKRITETADGKEVKSEDNDYENQDVMVRSKRGTSEQHSTWHRRDEDAGEDQQDSLYQNFTTEDDIYCNEVYIKASNR